MIERTIRSCFQNIVFEKGLILNDLKDIIVLNNGHGIKIISKFEALMKFYFNFA